MNKPEFPEIMPREFGLQITLTKEDLPCDWPEYVAKLGGYIMDSCDAEVESFKLAMTKFRDYLMGVSSAIEEYDSDFGDDKPVPEWYPEIGSGWLKDEDEEDWLNSALDSILMKGVSAELELKCNLLLALLDGPWPDFIDDLINLIDDYLKG